MVSVDIKHHVYLLENVVWSLACGLQRDRDVVRSLHLAATGVFQMIAVSTLMNTPRLKNFVFRNYNLPPSTYSQYPGSCIHELWEVIRASSAAPGYYEDFPLGDYVHSVSEDCRK